MKINRSDISIWLRAVTNETRIFFLNLPKLLLLLHLLHCRLHRLSLRQLHVRQFGWYENPLLLNPLLLFKQNKRVFTSSPLTSEPETSWGLRLLTILSMIRLLLRLPKQSLINPVAALPITVPIADSPIWKKSYLAQCFDMRFAQPINKNAEFENCELKSRNLFFVIAFILCLH